MSAPVSKTHLEREEILSFQRSNACQVVEHLLRGQGHGDVVSGPVEACVHIAGRFHREAINHRVAGISDWMPRVRSETRKTSETAEEKQIAHIREKKSKTTETKRDGISEKKNTDNRKRRENHTKSKAQKPILGREQRPQCSRRKTPPTPFFY